MGKKSTDTRISTARGEVLRFKSPAEFFSENKNIAGFDNDGKCLYTTVRELVENALDACESIRQLPDVDITLEELDTAGLNEIIGVTTHERQDKDLYEDKLEPKKKGGRKKKIDEKKPEEEAAIVADGEDPTVEEATTKSKKNERLFYRVVVRDNGCGMKHENIPDMLGRVLAGSKYGVRQTRGKFGLGAKMALIWSKQSTGMPIEVRSSTSASGPVTVCVLDIDIQKNEPRVQLHEKIENTSGMRGTEISLVVGGSWSSYRSYIVRYLRQMAVITPYARFSLKVSPLNHGSALSFDYARRSDEMPQEPATINHHPSSVNVELLKQLLYSTKHKLLKQFLSKDLSNIDGPLAGRLLTELRLPADCEAASLDDKQATRLAQLLKEAKFQDPSGDCLSPVGEYNMRLGIIKELKPDIVATYQDVACTVEGHPTMIEAGVSIGGKDVKPGIAVYRFANRIPLLFEGGADVATVVSKKRINWGNYKIRQNQDKIGVFVSLVSTKVPFKGTGKEYIGDDIPEVKQAVKRAIEKCCVQLKVKLLKQKALSDDRERRKNLTKYIPDVSRAFFSVISMIADKEQSQASASTSRKLDDEERGIVDEVRHKRLKVETLSEKLRIHIEQCDASSALEQVTATGVQQPRRELFLSPRHDALDLLPDMHHPRFIFRLHACAMKESS